MKILTKEQEAEHYRQTLKGGTIGGLVGLAVGTAGVVFAHRRYHFFRNLTIPLKAFLITSSGTFAGIVEADHYSRSYESQQNPIDVEYQQRQADLAQAERAGKTWTERAWDFGRRERYKIVAGSWIASMATAFALVNRNKYLTGPQKIVQARVYAQFLTVGVLVATAAFEISDQRNQTGRYETVRYVDPSDPEHKRMIEKQVEREVGSQGSSGNASDDMWKEMVAAEEQRMKDREARHKEYQREHAHAKRSDGSNHGPSSGNGNGNGNNKKKAAEHNDNDAGDDSKKKKDDK